LLALLGAHHILHVSRIRVNTLNAQLNPICHLLALLAAHHILHVSRMRVKKKVPVFLCPIIPSSRKVTDRGRFPCFAGLAFWKDYNVDVDEQGTLAD
jgi:hypothetical protein